jgi:protein-S-isoprenylcysteine O-methyltransferase Ste14
VLARIIHRIEGTWLFHALNLAVAAVWVHDGTKAVLSFVQDRQISALLMSAMNALLVVFYVSRRRSTAVGTSWKVVILANLGTWGGFLYQTAEPLHPAVDRPAIVFMSIVLVVTLGAFLSLGRSWGIIPANRGVRTGGLYRIVRHPIYGCYILFDSAFLLSAATWRNLAVFVATALVLYARACYEEELLLGDPVYAAYATRTRYRLFPGLV